MNLIPVLQPNGTIQTIAFSLPEEVYAKEKVGKKLWYFRLNNEGIEEIYINDDSCSRSFYKCGSAMYKTLAANYYKRHYEVCDMSEFMGIKQWLITYQETM